MFCNEMTVCGADRAVQQRHGTDVPTGVERPDPSTVLPHRAGAREDHHELQSPAALVGEGLTGLVFHRLDHPVEPGQVAARWSVTNRDVPLAP